MPERLEILAIGDELLDGRVVDTNTIRLAEALGAVGGHLSHRASVTDDIAAIVAEARASANRGTTTCVLSGGLGPTSDDLTAAAMAQLCGVPLVRDAAQASRISELIASRGRTVTANQLKQADRPQGAQLLHNAHGTAPGFAVHYQGCRFVALPGVPREFMPMLHDAVIAPMGDRAPVQRRALYCFGLLEAEVDRRLGELGSQFPGVRLQFRLKFPDIHVTMHAPLAHSAQLETAHAWAATQLAPHVYATHSTGPGLAATVLRLLQARRATLAVAESCTGGLLADLLTDVPGSSAAYLLGVNSYSNASKVDVLGVESAMLNAHGSVSEAVVLQMARGVRRLAKATYGLSTSGIAGPGGGTATKPVGMLWLGLSGPEGDEAICLQLHWDRRAHKEAGCANSLELLRRWLLAHPRVANTP